MSPHCPAIFLQHSRSAAVIAALGTTHAITGSAANKAARAKTPILRESVNWIIVNDNCGLKTTGRKRFRITLVTR